MRVKSGPSKGSEGGSVEWVPKDRKAIDSQLRPDLMFPAREELNLQRSVISRLAYASVPKPRFLALGVTLNPPPPRARGEAIVELGALTGLPHDQRDITLVDLSPRKAAAHAASCLRGSGKQDKP